MSKASEMSKITQERIENVFDEFVVNKIIAELDPIKKDFKRSNDYYADRTTGEIIENIYQSVGDMKSSVEAMKKSIIHQDPTWKMSEQIQSVVDSQTDITDDIESINENLSVLKEDVSAQLLVRSDEINKSIENAVNVIVAQNEEKTKNTTVYLQELCENLQALSGDFTKEFNSFAESNQEKINIGFDSVAKKIDDSNRVQSQAINKQREFLIEYFDSVSKKIDNSNVAQSETIKMHSETLIDRFDKVENSLETFNDIVNQNAQSIKDEIFKTSDSAIQSIGEGISSVENTSTQNTSELKSYIFDILAEYERKMADSNASKIKNINLLLKILIGISSINAVGIVTAIILCLIF